MNLIRLKTVALTLGERVEIVMYWSKRLGIKHYADSAGHWYFTERASDELRHARYMIRVELFTVKGARRQLDKLRETTRQLHQADTQVNAGMPIGHVRKTSGPSGG